MMHYTLYLCLWAVVAVRGDVPELQQYLAPPPVPASAPDSASVVPAAIPDTSVETPLKYEIRKDVYVFNAPAENQANQPLALHSQSIPVVNKLHKYILKKAISINVPKKAKSQHQVITQYLSKPTINYVSHNSPVDVSTQTSIDLNEQKHAFNVNSEHFAPAASNNINSQHRPSSKSEIHFISYKTPAEAQKIQQYIIQQYGGGQIVELPGKVIEKNLNKQNLDSAIANFNKQYPAPADSFGHASKISNVNSHYLPPATTTNTNTQLHSQTDSTFTNLNAYYLPPVTSSNKGSSSSLQVPGAASNINSQYLPPAASNLNSQYQAPAHVETTQQLTPAILSLNSQPVQSSATLIKGQSPAVLDIPTNKFTPAAVNVNSQNFAPLPLPELAASAPLPSKAYIPPANYFFKY